MIMEGPTVFLARRRCPDACATIGQVLQTNGYSTFWLGKNHNVPTEDIASGGVAQRMAAAEGLRSLLRIPWWRNQQLVSRRWSKTTASSISRTRPKEGYHLSKDLADQAIRMIRDQQPDNPSKPWFMWFCPGANHAPHHTPKEYADKYKGKFDDGYEAYREWVLTRMIDKGHSAQRHSAHADQSDAGGCSARRRRDAVRPWNTLNADEKKLFSRHGGSVTLAFSEYTDAQVGRIMEYLEKTNSSTTRSSSTAPTTAHPAKAPRTAPSTRTSSSTAIPDDLSENLKYSTIWADRTRTTTIRRAGPSLSDAVPDVQALLAVRRRHLRSDGDPLAQGHQGQGRSAPPVSPLDRHCPDDPRRAGLADAEGIQRRRAVPA